jgi:hypothetical protein
VDGVLGPEPGKQRGIACQAVHEVQTYGRASVLTRNSGVVDVPASVLFNISRHTTPEAFSCDSFASKHAERASPGY